MKWKKDPISRYNPRHTTISKRDNKNHNFDQDESININNEIL